MLRITLDLFSGRRNPTWLLAGPAPRQFQQTLVRQRPPSRPKDTAPPRRLGYRSTVIEVLASSKRVRPTRYVLTGSRDLELTEHLLSLPGAVLPSPFTNTTLLELLSADSKPRPRPRPTDPLPAPTPCAYETISYNPKYWNAPAHVLDNNCYAYAANRRTDTFPQPGRASGREAAHYDCVAVAAAACSDGASVGCPSLAEKPRLLVALVIWPGADYHWYRFHSDGFWSHKPGGTPALKEDESGSVILDPRTADRGPYTEFCRFLLIPRSIRVA